jgi:hypothetical protein
VDGIINRILFVSLFPHFSFLFSALPGFAWGISPLLSHAHGPSVGDGVGANGFEILKTCLAS